MRRNSGLAFAAIDVLGCLFLVALLRIGSPAAPHVPTPGTFAIVMTWPAGDNDIDLYVRTPSGTVAFYASPSVGAVHLEHDDLGTLDSSYHGENAERAVIRYIDPGEFTVNAHVYRRSEGQAPIPVHIVLWDLQGEDHVVTEQDVTVLREGDERTAFRFTLTRAGQVVDVNHLPAHLANGDPARSEFTGAVP